MITLAEAAIATRGRLNGSDVRFDGVTTDSRKIKAGDLFIALRGEHFDGHDFVAQSFSKGAVAAMVDEQSVLADQEPAKALVTVQDTRLALGDLAGYWRKQFSIPLAAVTGSNGKTTVKEMLASILRVNSSHQDSVLATVGNLNNDIGLPLTLLKLRASHHHAVVEMGMSHSGEIAYLSQIAKPTVALINNAGAAHLQGLGSVEAVARAKGEIFAGLTAEGVAVINADDPFASLWLKLAGSRKRLLFGLEQSAEVSADYVMRTNAIELTLKTTVGSVDFTLNVLGQHNLRNALAASAVALAMNVPLSHIASGLQRFEGVRGRLQRKVGYGGSVLIDDTYNANPSSMLAAIDVLVKMPGKKIFIMGDMGELGESTKALHREMGLGIKSAGIDCLYALGAMSAEAVAAFGRNARHFDSVEALVEIVRKQLVSGVTVVVKGSRFMAMERVVDALMEKESRSCC